LDTCNCIWTLWGGHARYPQVLGQVPAVTPWGVEGSLRTHLRLSLRSPALAGPKASECHQGALQQSHIALARHLGSIRPTICAGSFGEKRFFLCPKVPTSHGQVGKLNPRPGTATICVLPEFPAEPRGLLLGRWPEGICQAGQSRLNDGRRRATPCLCIVGGGLGWQPAFLTKASWQRLTKSVPTMHLHQSVLRTPLVL
jgi:hypothetical protein